MLGNSSISKSPRHRLLSSLSQPIETIWQKNAVPIDQSSGRFHIGPYNRTLEVRGIIADDQGAYSCHVRIRYSDAFVNATAQLIVRGKHPSTAD